MTNNKMIVYGSPFFVCRESALSTMRTSASRYMTRGVDEFADSQDPKEKVNELLLNGPLLVFLARAES